MALASRKSRIRLSFALANERGQMPALLTRSLGKGSLKAIRYIHRTPWRGASSGLYPPTEDVRFGLSIVNPEPWARSRDGSWAAPSRASANAGLPRKQKDQRVRFTAPRTAYGCLAPW